ncbi:YbaY family lipoprotein [Aquitalea sp. LB_tupeE]|uniref:YbaY family lipoprotein n=1 Tax=Aquitalea sp. LB_tupeE TaxID=2748078 RepID=UPI0015C0CF25|nr:YbaY family lipoprotein [Aquitalea sp. LB_tupeE]NWK76879.1 YbaY family lipoprotein [Aquitalea sp. LB_tupeE]
MHRYLRSTALFALALAMTGCASKAYQPQYLNGKVTLATPANLPLATTLVRVRLLDERQQADAPARLLAEQTLEKPRSFPVSYSLCYDKQAIQTNGSYSVQAQVYVDGELRLQNTSHINAFGTEAALIPVELIK